jgi:hypothetical protein
MSLGALSISPEHLKQEYNRVKNIITGISPGITSKIISSEDTSDLVPLKDYLGEPQPQSGASVAAATYERATMRDVPYALLGRRALFTFGLNRKLLLLRRRGA